ncbi:toll-like receptor 2 isoform 1-T2 [Discoglossus pictus]
MHCIFRITIIYSLVTSVFLQDLTDCHCDLIHFCDCSSMNWNTFPSRLPMEMRGLNISYNKIQVITEADLKPYNKLDILLLQHNIIHTINDYSFQSLKSLKDLDLSYNNLAVLSSTWFRNLPMLKHLNLLGNFYTVLGSLPLFSSLPSLQSLQIGNLYLNEIEKQNFEGLSVLNKFSILSPNLKQYADGSFKVINTIGHIILKVNISLLPNIIKDLAYSVTLLEITDTSLENVGDMEAFKVLHDTTVEKIKFKNCLITDDSILRLLEILSTYNNVTELIVDDCELRGTGQFYPFPTNKTSSVTSAVINNLYIHDFYLFSDLSSLYKEVGHFKRITCSNTKVFLIPCEFSKSFLALEYLDVNSNLLADIFLEMSACYGSGEAWPQLQTLNVSKNLLTSLQSVAQILSKNIHLINLDVSQNNFGDSPMSSCKWPPKLKYLNISSCQIKRLHKCVPPTLEILDISNNHLTELLLDLPFLKELDISNNRLTKLPDVRLPGLVIQIISKNKINDFYESDLHFFPNLTTLDGRDNNYVCSCQFLDFIQDQTHVTLIGWPDNYVCDSPPSVRGITIKDAKLPVLFCHKTLVVTLSCIILIIFIAIIVALCHFLHVIWYLKMTWAWLKAKKKPLTVTDREICYDAFISYSERDSEWVENMMVQELENAEPPLKLCLHKRDFVPGKWIIDNIIDAMEKSYKTLFILSEHFVQSEWCKYELDFSHFRLFDENNDTAILILLEPIEKETIPKRFCKLRKLMNTKTYMEWPTDEEQQKTFWFNLKAVLHDYDSS